MKWIADTTHPKRLHLEISHDSEAGYYLYVWENGKGIRDDLQDTLEWAMTVALDSYGVPKSAWKETL